MYRTLQEVNSDCSHLVGRQLQQVLQKVLLELPEAEYLHGLRAEAYESFAQDEAR